MSFDSSDTGACSRTKRAYFK